MPHSSGGGSRGGGVHGGFGGGVGGGFGYRGSSPLRSSEYRKMISRNRFAGSKKYRIDRGNEPYYFYSNYDPAAKPVRTGFEKIFCIFMTIVLIPVMIVCLLGGYEQLAGRKKIAMNYNTQIVIQDSIGVLGDTGELEKALTEFQNTTGITPAIFTTSNDLWKNENKTLMEYAYDQYVENFADESHWLIIYSQDPENDWYWEGMQGDDTDPILSRKKCREFNMNLQRYFLNRTDYTVAQALTKAFSELTPGLMKGEMPYFIVFVVVFLFCLIVLCAVYDFNPWMLKYRKAVLCENKENE